VLEKAIAQGQPAIFQHFAGQGQEQVIAPGFKIEFLDTNAEQSVKISQNALLQQGGITAVCNEITFILENGVVQYLDGSRGDSQCQVSSNGNNPSQTTTNQSETTSNPNQSTNNQ